MAVSREGLRRPAALQLLLLLWLGSVLAAPQFPPLTGRVVDGANLLSGEERAQLEQQLQQHETLTENQVVVVTLASLGGDEIADYGYQLGRHWGIGQKGKDNGVLLIVAPNEREVRIEVGYGLEGTLTDKLAHDIIQNRILPRFRGGSYAGGIRDGAEAILAALGGHYQPSRTAQAPPRTSGRKTSWEPSGFLAFLFFGAFGLANLFSKAPTLKRIAIGGGLGLVSGWVSWWLSGDIILGIFIAMTIFIILSLSGRGDGGSGHHSFGGTGGYSSGGYSSGGFRGGGGSFGGGGASGRW